MGKVILNITYTSKFPPGNYDSAKKSEYIARRNFYNLTADYNYFSYTLQDKKITTNATADEYFRKGNGLFNCDGAISDEKFSEIKKALKTTDSIIWHGVISFDEETSKLFETEEQASEFLKRTFSSIIAQTHLDVNNLELFASLHKDTDNRHIHLAFFEKEPKHINSKCEKVYTSKGKLNVKAFENYVVSSNMNLRENKDLYFTARNEVIEKLKSLKSAPTTDEIKKLVLPLADELKGKGRLQYNSDNLKDLRGQIDVISERLMKTNKFLYESHKAVLKEINALDRKARQICIENSYGTVNGKKIKAEQLKGLRLTDFTFLDENGNRQKLTVGEKSLERVEWVERLRKDYYARIGNQVIKLAREVKKAEQTSKQKSKSTGNKKSFNDKPYKAERRSGRAGTKRAINSFVKGFSPEQMRENEEFRKRLKEIEKELHNEESK